MNRIMSVAAALSAMVMSGCCYEAALPKAESWGTTKYGEEAHLWTLEGKDGLKLVVSDFGGRVVECWAPDRDGNMADVTLGCKTVADYEKYGFCLGTLIGRFGNRIKDGKFTLDGNEYQLAVNETTPEPRHCNLHSGPIGWDAKVWAAEPFVEGDVKGILFTLVSPDGDMGFPGTVTARVAYTVHPGNVWRIEYEATTDKATVINLTHHSYWNMAGESSGNVLEQTLKINADYYTKTDAGLIPTENAPVKDTGFDFTTSRPINAKADWMAAQADLACTDNWYDHNFVLNGESGKMHLAAVMHDPKSGRLVTIRTTEPCMQMYGAQNMTSEIPAKAEGKTLCQFAGMAIETQHYPDSPNRPDFPSTVLRPGELYRSTTEYRFSAR